MGIPLMFLIAMEGSITTATGNVDFRINLYFTTINLNEAAPYGKESRAS